MTTTGYYVDGKGYIQIEDWEKDRFLSQYPGARQREKGKQVHYEIPNKGRIEISPEEETTFLSQYPNAVPSKYLEQRQSLLAETKKLTTDPLKLAELALPISDETLLTKYNAAITGQKEASKLDAPSGYESGYAIGKVGKKQASQMLPSSIMPSGRTLKEEQDAEEAYGSIRQGKKRSVFKDSGKYIADIVKGFGLATGTMTMLPLSGAYNLFGEQEKAQQIQGYIDAKYEKYGFSKPIEGNLLEQGRAGELIAAGFRSFIQSAPITAMWVANPVLGTTLSFATAAPQKYNELDREHPELETRTKAISALVSGGLEAATEHLGNVIGIGKTLKLGSKLPEEAFRALLTKRLTEITTKTMLKHWAIESLSEGGEEFVGYIGEYATDCALGIIEYDPKAFMDGLINATVLGTVSGSMQGSIGMTRNMVLNSRYTNIEAKLQKSANKDLSNISDPAKYNAANNLKTLAQKTIAAVEMAQAGDTQGAIELAQENNNYILRTRMAKAGSASLDTIGMYNALILDTITSVETIQAAENAVPEEKAPRKPKPKSELPVVDTPKVETAPLYEMAQEALKSKDLEQITAAKTAFAEALSETANPNEIQQLRSMIAKLNKAEKGILDAEAETKKKSEPVVKESLTTETEESRYTKMAWPDLRAEAKERGINTFGANKAYIIEKLTAMDVEEAAKPKPVELSNEDMNAASVDIKGIVTPAMEANTEADFDTAISKLNKMLDGAHDIVRSMIGTELDKLRKAKLKLGPKDIKLNVADQSAAMDVGEVNETIDHRDPAESKVIPKEQVGNEAIVTKEGEDIPVKYALVDIDDVIVSQNLDSFEDNPEYPKPLQNRERKDQEATVIGYAQNLKPALLGDAAVASDGRPIAYIDTNGRVVIIAGNGRTMAIQMRHKGRYGSLSQYAQYIKENLSKFGISDQDTKGKMLVAIYSGDTDLVSLARLLNKSEQKELSPVEKAQSDAVAIANARKNGNDILLKLDGSTKGLMTEANKPFIDAFVDLNISSTERDIYYKNDIYTTLLSERIENALFMYIFNNDAKAERLLSNLRELDSSSVKSILKAIMDNVKPIARLRNLIEVYDTLDYDITQDLLDGVAEIDRLRKEGIPIGEAISEQDIFSESNQLIPDAKIMFYTALAALKSQVKADNFIAGYYSAAITALDPEQSSIFDSNLSKEDFLNEYCEEWLGEDAPERSKKTDDTQSDRSSPEPEAGKDAADVKAKLAKTAEVVPTPVVAENAITPEELAAKEKQLTKDKKALEAADKKLAALEARIDKADDAGRDTGDMEDKLADLEDVIADLEDKINVAEEEIKEFTKNLPKPVKADIAPTEKLTPTQNFHDQYTEAQQGKLTAEQITAQLEVIDTMFGTFAKTMGLTLDQVYDSWIEAVTNEQLDPNSIENALNQEISISSGPAIKSTVIPKKTVRAYRMGWLNPDGTVSSVKVDESQKTRQNFEMGVWYDAEMRKSNMALIPGFHFAYLPSLPQLYRQDGTPFENRVYYIAEYDATISYQEQADATKEKFLRGIIPENGFYFRRSGKIKQWAISGKMMPVRVLSMAEVDAINKAAGVETINGMPVAEFEKRQKKAKRLNQDLAAYVTFDKDGKATIGFLKPDISSGLHEASHIFRKMMAQMADKDIRWSKLYDTAMTFSEVENGNWTVENEEKFAKGFEKFLATGQASNPKIATVFSKIKAWMQELVSRLKDLKGIKLDANISAVYDAMLGGKPKEHLTQAQKAAATKVKKAMVASSTANPIQLQKSLDQLVDQLGTVVLRSKKTGSTTNMVISGIDNNVNLVEIVHTSEGYIVNGNAYDNNADAMDAVTNLLSRNSASQTLPQTLAQLAKDDAGFVAKKIAAVEAAYRRAWIRLRSSNNVQVWRNAMSTAIDRFIRINYNGAKPFDQAKAAEILSSEMDEKEMAKKIRRMKALDKKYYDAIEQETGYRSLDEIPTIQLATVMYDIAPNSYDSFMSDGTLDSIRELIPTLASMGNMYGDVYTDVFLQTLVDASVFGRAKHQVISGFVGSILQSNKVLLKLFGKAGGKLITKALIAKTLHSEINNASQVYLNEIYDILYTTKNSMGHRYGVEDVSRIGEAIFNVENNKNIPTEDKLSAIQEMLSENETISPEDVATIYEAGRELMDFFAELNDNFNRKYKRKIGKQENYFPRIRIGDEIYGSTAPDGKYLYTPGFTKHRNKDEIDTRQINTDFHKVLREYSYRMSRYLSFYELADYVQPNDLIVNGQRIPQKSGFYRDTTLALSGNISSYEKYVVDYVHEVIGYHQSKGTASRALSKMKVAAYTSLLAANAKLTMQNFGQKTLIFAAVGSHAAIPAAKDLKFLSGKAKITTPLIDKLLSGYLSHNQSLLLDTVAEMKRGTNSDRLDYYKSADYAETFADDTPNKKGKIKRAQHRAFAHQKVSQSYSLYSEVLTRSPFQYAEKGNRAYAHLAGVYEIVMATPAYQEAIKQGKTRHEAAEIALADPNIYRAAQTHGAAINAAVNADADSVFSPSVYRGPLKEFMTFLRYGHTFSLLMFNTFLPKSMKNAWSSDLYRLSMSGQTGVVKKAEIIRAMQSMIDLTSRSRIDAMVKSGQVTIRATEGKLTAKQVDSINRMLTKQMDAYVTGAKQFKKLVYGKNPKGILALGSFIIADAIFSFIYSYLRDLWISSINPDAHLRERSLEDHIFDSIQVIRFMNGFDIGSGLFINERGFGHSWRNLTKATLEWASRITPAGLTNNVSREYYGKYLTDEAVDLMLDE